VWTLRVTWQCWRRRRKCLQQSDEPASFRPMVCGRGHGGEGGRREHSRRWAKTRHACGVRYELRRLSGG
jgi:hypothetical protein